MTNNSAHQSDLELQTVTPFSLRKIPARIFQALGWFALNTVLGIMYSLLISFYSPEPFLRVFLTAQITTHALCILVEVTLFTAGPSLFRTGERKKQPVRYFLLATLCAVLAAIAGVFVGGAVHEALLGFDPYVNNRFFNVIFGSIIIAIGVTSLERLIRSLNERRIEALQALQEARLSVLQERMRPHFLFNTLNTIHSLLPGDPRAADSALMQLAESYRFLLNSAEKQRIPFQEEWDFCSDYIDLMKLRFGDRLNVQMEKIGGFQEVQIPPLTIQPLIENAIRHGIQMVPGAGTLAIKATQHGDSISVQVVDSGPGVNPEFVTSRTLENIRLRLGYYYRGASVSLKNRTGGGAQADLHFRFAD